MAEVTVPAILKAAELAGVPKATIEFALKNAKVNLNAIGSAWGDDEIGDQWAGPYVPGRENVFEGLHDISVGLGQLADLLRNMGILYGSVEDANLQ